MTQQRCLIVGAGFAGAVLARELAEAGIASHLIDARDHIGGNCHTERDEQTGVMLHVYGPHIFNTNNHETWNYIQRFSEFGPYINRVKAITDRGVFSLPINLLTINQLFGQRLNPREAEAYIRQVADQTIGEPGNFEEQALKMLGPTIYETFFRGYTIKQWGVDPKELPASVLKRLPVRFNYNDAYYASRYQGIPVDGYTKIIERILDHPLIHVELGVVYEPAMAEAHRHTFYSGSLDQFLGYKLGRLGYRTVYWDRIDAEGDYQGNAVINYPSLSVDYTRIHEHKHFTPWESHKNSAVFVEYSKATGKADIPYYPTRLAQDKALAERMVDALQGYEQYSFIGRLGTYRYLDMDQVILESRQFAQKLILAGRDQWHLPAFRFAATPNSPPPPK